MSKKQALKKDEFFIMQAKLMALWCVRNTILEDIHSEGKITQSQMMELNIEVTNRIYTFLKLVDEKNGIPHNQMVTPPNYWKDPELDKEMFILFNWIDTSQDLDAMFEEWCKLNKKIVKI